MTEHLLILSSNRILISRCFGYSDTKASTLTGQEEVSGYAKTPCRSLGQRHQQRRILTLSSPLLIVPWRRPQYNTGVPRQPSQSPTAKPAAFRHRLGALAGQLIAAQALYLALGLYLLYSGFTASTDAPSRAPFTIAAFALGILGVAASFPAVKMFGRRQPPGTTFPALAAELQRRFFIGFAFSEIASLAGLLIFFLFADIITLIVLVAVASTSIAAHYRRLRKIVDDFERTPG